MSLKEHTRKGIGLVPRDEPIDVVAGDRVKSDGVTGVVVRVWDSKATTPDGPTTIPMMEVELGDRDPDGGLFGKSERRFVSRRSPLWDVASRRKRTAADDDHSDLTIAPWPDPASRSSAGDRRRDDLDVWTIRRGSRQAASTAVRREAAGVGSWGGKPAVSLASGLDPVR